jgi:glutamate racemase
LKTIWSKPRKRRRWPADYLVPLQEAAVDTLILGCTHYPLMSDLIQRVVGPGVKLISSAEETAAEVKEILSASGMLSEPRCGEPNHSYFVSGKPGLFEAIGSKMLQRRIKAYQVVFNG